MDLTGILMVVFLVLGIGWVIWGDFPEGGGPGWTDGGGFGGFGGGGGGDGGC